MTNTNEWYIHTECDVPLTQGDIIFDCPLVSWQDTLVDLSGKQELEVLKDIVEAVSGDVIVMTQACDLENKKVKNVVVCAHWSIEDYKRDWQVRTSEKGGTIAIKDWERHCKSIKDGVLWNLSMLNEGESNGLTISRRVVEFHNIFTVPRTFIESLLSERKKPRLRLLPPYREHLSQAFARYFMRVGLPVGVNSDWSVKASSPTDQIE